MAPKKRVRTRERRAHHAMTDRFKNLCPSQIGDQKAKYAAGGLFLGQDVRAGARPPRDQAESLQFVYCLGDGDARGVKRFTQLSLAGQPVTCFIGAGLYGPEEAVKNLPVLGQIDFRHISGGPSSPFRLWLAGVHPDYSPKCAVRRTAVECIYINRFCTGKPALSLAHLMPGSHLARPS